MSDIKIEVQGDVLSTNDLSIFKILPGNREVSANHVKGLVRLFGKYGNRTPELPIEVDPDMYVLDGQHRLAAAKELGWPVAYRIIDTAANVELVRLMNSSQRNWSAIDVIRSYAGLGNEEYQWILEYIEQHELSFSEFKSLILPRGANTTFRPRLNAGEIQVDNKPLTHERARQWVEIRDVLVQTNSFYAKGIISRAWSVIRRSPVYDHQRMVKKLQENGGITIRSSALDYQREFERVYNRNYTTETRLF